MSPSKLISLCALGVLIAGVHAAHAQLPSRLAGTQWRLVEFQSMSDEVGTLRPEDPSRYTMRLEPDGRVSMRLDCNLASGTWTARESRDGASGSFRFGSLAGTRALCRRPGLARRVLRDAPWIRGYLLRDGGLFLSLMADGGIYAWSPIDPAASAGAGEMPAAPEGR